MGLLFKIADQVGDFGRHDGAGAKLAPALRVRMSRVLLHPVERCQKLLECLRQQSLPGAGIDARLRDICL